MHPDPDLAEASKGIIAPKLLTLERGTLLFRFASSQQGGAPTTEDDWYRSPWWILEGAFHRIYQRGLSKSTGMSDHRDQTLSRNSRNGLAVCNSWSSMDMMVKAQLRGSIRAYAGQGLPQMTCVQDQTQQIQITPNLGITQLYICNMKEIGPTMLARAGFHALSLSGN